MPSGRGIVGEERMLRLGLPARRVPKDVFLEALLRNTPPEENPELHRELSDLKERRRRGELIPEGDV